MSEQNNALKGFIGLMHRAGKVVYGETLLTNVKSQKVFLVIASIDIGKSVLKQLSDKCLFNNVPLFQILSKEELSKSIGKSNCSALGILDPNGAEKIKKIMKAGE